MKITTTITAEERDAALDDIMLDPCLHIQCGEIDCEECPLHTAVKALRKAQEDYEKAINKITIKGE